MADVWSFAFPAPGPQAITLSDRAFGLRIEPWHDGEQRAWVKSAHNVWLAVVEVSVASSNGRVQVRPCLWLPASAITLPRH